MAAPFIFVNALMLKYMQRIQKSPAGLLWRIPKRNPFAVNARLI
jgi:hypothetical protein